MVFWVILADLIIAIFGKIGKSASDEDVLQQLLTTCVMAFAFLFQCLTWKHCFYTLRIRFLDFAVNILMISF